MKIILRNILGCLLIITGFFGMFTDSALVGIFLMLFGISLLPVFYQKTKLNIKYIQIILPIVLFCVFSVAVSITADKKTKLHLNESVVLLDIGETKEVVLEVESGTSELEEWEYCTSNDQVAVIQKVNDDENGIILKIQSIGEGCCEVYVRSASGAESNRVFVNIVNHERIEQERKEKEESEAQAQKESEEQAKKESEAQAQKESEEQAKKESETQTQPQEPPIISSNNTTIPGNNSGSYNTNNTHGAKVYRTPSGKRYHFDPDCGGKNSRETTMEAAISAGLTPCKKCAY